MHDRNSELGTYGRYLDAYRDAVVWKVEGVALEDAARPQVPSGTSLLGVLKHLGHVERWWFQAVIAGRHVERPEESRPSEFRAEPGETVESIVAFFRTECAQSREILDGLDDPQATVSFRDGELSVREILVHLVEEIARHAGHMDILREQIDGATGGMPPGAAPWQR